MTTTPFKPGFYTTKAPASSVAGDWRLAGWTARTLRLPEDLGKDPRKTVLQSLGTALRFPEYYGANLDALDECLRDLDAPTVLVWMNGGTFADEHSAVWSKISDVLTDRVKAQPPFAVVLAGGEKKGL